MASSPSLPMPRIWQRHHVRRSETDWEEKWIWDCSRDAGRGSPLSEELRFVTYCMETTSRGGFFWFEFFFFFWRMLIIALCTIKLLTGVYRQCCKTRTVKELCIYSLEKVTKLNLLFLHDVWHLFIFWEEKIRNNNILLWKGKDL